MHDAGLLKLNILVAVHDLSIAKWHLMPWRTAVEIVRELRVLGHNATLISLDNDAIDISYEESDVLPAGTIRICKQRDRLEHQLGQLCEQSRPDVLFWPVTWREARWRTRIIVKLPLKIVGWFPGGVYTRSDSLYALRKMGLRPTIRYLLEAFYPKSSQILFLKTHGIDALLTMTTMTARVAVEHGWPSEMAFSIPPGRDAAYEQVDPLPESVQAWLGDDSYLLFMGPPSAIRGIDEVLDAFALVSQVSRQTRLICLFRADSILEGDRITRKIAAMACNDRIYTAWESLPRPLLNGFIRACHAVVMPFILVPSEIPLAIIETIAHGKPVLSTLCGGTGEFVANFGAVTPVGDTAALSRSMLKMLTDQDYYFERCQKASEAYAGHPHWDKVTRGWAEVAEIVTREYVQLAGD